MPLALLLLLAADFPSLFQPSIATDPRIQKAISSIDERRDMLVGEWIRITEVPSPSGGEQKRASYIRAELEAMGLIDVGVDPMGNLSARRKGTEPGPPIVFAATWTQYSRRRRR